MREKKKRHCRKKIFTHPLFYSSFCPSPPSHFWEFPCPFTALFPHAVALPHLPVWLWLVLKSAYFTSFLLWPSHLYFFLHLFFSFCLWEPPHSEKKALNTNRRRGSPSAVWKKKKKNMFRTWTLLSEQHRTALSSACVTRSLLNVLITGIDV